MEEFGHPCASKITMDNHMHSLVGSLENGSVKCHQVKIHGFHVIPV